MHWLAQARKRSKILRLGRKVVIYMQKDKTETYEKNDEDWKRAESVWTNNWDARLANSTRDKTRSFELRKRRGVSNLDGTPCPVTMNQPPWQPFPGHSELIQHSVENRAVVEKHWTSVHKHTAKCTQKHLEYWCHGNCTLLHNKKFLIFYQKHLFLLFCLLF